MSVMLGVIAAVLGVSAICAIYRAARGPSILDRVIAVDVLLAIVGGALAADMVFNGHTNTLVILVATSLIGFITSVAVARFVIERK